MSKNIALLLAFSLGACSSVDHAYLSRSYNAKADDAIKRIAVAGWSSTEHPEVGELLARIGSDLVKLRKNYLVYEPVALKRDFGEACGDLQGVLSLRAQDIQVEAGTVTARVVAELHRCVDGRLVWRAEAQDAVASSDADLANLTGVYVRQMGAAAERFAAPMFALVQDLIQTLPDPELNDEEVIEKIELGRFEIPARFKNLVAFTF